MSDTANTDSESPGQKDEPAPISRPGPYEYLCFLRPFFDRNQERIEENVNKNVNTQVTLDELTDLFNEDIKRNHSLWEKTASEVPRHKWINMKASWDILLEYKRRATYTNPDYFDMHINNDFHGYGLQELIENLFVSFDRELNKLYREGSNVKQVWAIAAGMAHWLNEDQFDAWIGCEDGARVRRTASLVGRLFVTSLHELHLAGMLKQDSEVKDLGLVISMFLEWSHSLTRFSIYDTSLEWSKEVVAYAKTAKIDLEAVGCYGVQKRIDALEKSHGIIDAFREAPITDRWSWEENFEKLESPGGERYNILKMSREERASHAFDGEDPLGGFSDEVLHRGEIVLTE